jgi:hypothetical protein
MSELPHDLDAKEQPGTFRVGDETFSVAPADTPRFAAPDPPQAPTQPAPLPASTLTPPAAGSLINDSDPAIKALYQAIDALKAIAAHNVILTQTADVPPRPVNPPVVQAITDTEVWHRLVVPVLTGPFMSPRV